MEEKVKRITDQIYQDGFLKGKHEAERIVSEAKNESERIIAHAKREARELMAHAHDEAELLKKKSEADIQRAAQQMLMALKGQLTQLISGKIAQNLVHATFNDIEFVKTLLLRFLENWVTTQGEGGRGQDLVLLFTQTHYAEFSEFLQRNLKQELLGGLQLRIGQSSGNGFQVISQDGGFQLDFSEESFIAFLSEFLRPQTQKLLFTKEQ